MNLRILPLLLLLLVPTGVFAQPTEEEFWAEQDFLYQFTFVQQAGTLVNSGYELTTGDEPIGTGAWSIVIHGPRNQTVARQYFDVADATTTVLVRYQPNGTSAEVLNPQGVSVLTMDMAGSRICDEDSVCESQYGEVSSNCPVDCGAPNAAAQTATIATSSGTGRRIGAILIGLALAVTGVLIVRGAGALLDRRHGA